MNIPGLTLGAASIEPAATEHLAAPTISSPSADAGERVDTLSVPYQQMARKWPLTRMLRGGTQPLRDGAQTWLPKAEAETDSAYAVRLSLSFLFGAYSDAIDTATAQPFSKAVSIVGKLPSRLDAMVENVDRQGASLSKFAEGVYDALVDDGVTHILVDYPEDAANLTLKGELDNKVTPYFTQIKAQDLIGWTFRKAVNGGKELTSIRYTERQLEKQGPYGDVLVDYIRVVTYVYAEDAVQGEEQAKGIWKLFRRDEKTSKFVKSEEGTHDYKGSSLETIYGERTGYMTGEPTMWKLAELNLKHAQCDSHYQNVIHFTSFPMLFGSGFSEDEIDKGIQVGPRKLIASSNPDASINHIESSGSAVGIGEKNLNKIEAQMTVLGLAPFVEKVSQQTATGQEIDAQKSVSDAKRWVRAVEQGLMRAFAIAANWADEKIPSGFAIQIFDDFGALSRAAVEMKDIHEARKLKDIDQRTYLKEMQNRQRLSEDADIDQIIEATETERQAITDDIDELLGVNEPEDEGEGDDE